jgi:uncharacterized membrane protein
MRWPRRLLEKQRIVAAGVAGTLLLVGLLLYPWLPTRMAIHWNAAGVADNVVARPIAVLAMPVVVVLLSVLLEFTNADADDRVVGSVAMAVLFVVQLMVFLVNLGFEIPIVPVSLVLCLGLVAITVWFEVR